MAKLVEILIPKYARKVKEIMPFTDLDKDPQKYASFSFFLSLIFSIIMAISIVFLTNLSFYYAILSFIGAFILIILLFYAYLVLQADKKASSIEQVLPDALQLMASNLRAGIIIDKALLLSAREEFGIFKKEIEKVAREVSTGKSMEEALTNITKKVKSDVFERTISLIVFGLRSGGELASLLEEAAASLRQQTLTQKQMRTNVMMYTILIFVALIIVSPALFALSSILVETLVGILSSVDMPAVSSMAIAVPVMIGEISMDSGFILLFSIIALIVTITLGSFVLGLIMTGEERNGLKFMPVLLVIAIAVFFIVRIFLSSLLGAFL